MNELIKITYDNDRPDASSQKLYEYLDDCIDFESFFVKVCELKISLDRDELKCLYDVVNRFHTRYSHKSIIYLRDCIMCEQVLPCKLYTERKQTERDYQKRIIQSFDTVFPNFEYQACEVVVPTVGRIDILAKEKQTSRPVIIELKMDGKNPTLQLLAYATKYKNAILIGISTCKIPLKLQNPQVKYYTYKELGLYE